MLRGIRRNRFNCRGIPATGCSPPSAAYDYNIPPPDIQPFSPQDRFFSGSAEEPVNGKADKTKWPQRLNVEATLSVIRASP